MKKFSVILASVLAAAMVFGGCANNEGGNSSSSESSQGSSSKEQLIMATEAGFAPYEYYEGNNVVGVDVDIAKAIADELGMELVIADMEFAAINPALESGKADIGIAGMSITPERLEEVDFSKEYATSEQVILVKEGSDITKPEDLHGKAVGVQLGTTADLYISEEMPDVTLQQYNKYMEAAQDLKNGRINAIVMDKLPAQQLLAENTDLVMLEDVLFTDTYAIAVKKGNTELLDKINPIIDQLIADGKIDEFTLNHTTK